MVKKIDRKIVAYQVKTRDEPQQPPVQDDVVHMHETVLRPERLMGTTYKLKTPEHVSEHSLFITINDIILNEGTVHETRRPFEIFINSKSLEHYQWIVALTRIISAVFRKGGRHLPGGGAALGVRSQGRLLEQGQVRTLPYRRNWQRDRNPSYRDRHAQGGRAG